MLKNILMKYVAPWAISQLGNEITSGKVKEVILDACDWFEGLAAKTENTIDDALAKKVCDAVRGALK